MTRPPIRIRSHVVYLLHFMEPVDGNRHYVGVTTPPRLAARMREHAAGRGSRATAAACVLPTDWQLARLWQTDDPRLETHIAGLRNLHLVCPACTGEDAIRTYTPTQKAPMRAWEPQAIDRLVSHSISATTDLRPMKKRRPRKTRPSSTRLRQP